MKIAAFVISVLSLFSLGSTFRGCDNINMNELCASPVVDRCYECVNNQPSKYPQPPVCVPVFKHTLGALDNYPSSNWNCTFYRVPDKNDNQQEQDEDEYDMNEEEYEEYVMEEMNDKLNEKEENTETKIVDDICKIDEFIVDVCNGEDKNGFCMIANYVHDICETRDTREESEKYQVYNHDEDLFGGKLYSACSGPICQKEGWTYKGSHFGKEWCGNSPCKEYFDNRVLCSFPTNCNSKKSLSSLEQEDFHKDFETLSCGREKFRCLLKKDCRNLLKQLDNCNNDLVCTLTLLYQVSQNNDDHDEFLNLVKCMVPSSSSQ